MIEEEDLRGFWTSITDHSYVLLVLENGPPPWQRGGFVSRTERIAEGVTYMLPSFNKGWMDIDLFKKHFRRA